MFSSLHTLSVSTDCLDTDPRIRMRYRIGVPKARKHIQGRGEGHQAEEMKLDWKEDTGSKRAGDKEKFNSFITLPGLSLGQTIS